MYGCAGLAVHATNGDRWMSFLHPRDMEFLSMGSVVLLSISEEFGVILFSYCLNLNIIGVPQSISETRLEY